MSFVFEVVQINDGATLSLRANRRHAQISEVMVVSLLKCRSFVEIIIVGYFCTVTCFLLIDQIMGLPSPLELTGGAPKILR